MDEQVTGHWPEYELHWRLGEAAKDAGRLQEARDHYAASLGVAERTGDRELVDRAFCNEACMAIALGEVEAPIAPLREVLMRNSSATNGYLASYHIARAYELRKEHKKSLFYARIARDRAEQLANPQRVAAANNQIGNALLAESSFEEAAASYRRALELVPEGLGDWQLICQSNLAYCEIVQGRSLAGTRRLYRALRTACRRGSRRLEMILRVDLCFGNLELNQLARAAQQGERGLALAEEIGEVDWTKNALYLLGQVAVMQQRTDEGRARFTELQRRFFPQQPSLPDFLVGVDVRAVINLRA
jgi:tetratricopeptide (TPR) repeat protein